MPNFAEAVAECSGHDQDLVAEVLDSAGIEAQPTPAAPVPLQIARLKFSGVKRRQDQGDEPFEFEQEFDPDLWVITSEPNLMGKSTILRVIEWAMTGRRGELTADVHAWIIRVELTGTVGGDEFAIRFDNDDGTVSGTLIAGVEILFDQSTFAEVTESFFMDRLGLDPTPFWQKRPKGREDEGDPSRHSWPSYFAAIHLPQENPKVLLGDGSVGGQPGILLQVFLGLSWARTAAAARVADNQAKMRRSAVRRRAADDDEARTKQLEPLRKELRGTREALAKLEAESPAATAASADAALAAFTAALADDRSTTDRVAQAEATVALAQASRDDAHKRLQALREAKVVRPLIGHLAPSMCPRCEAPVTADRREAEADTGSCSVCAETLEEPQFDEAELADAEAALEAADEDLQEAEQALGDAVGAAAAAAAARQKAQASLAEIEEARPVQEEMRGLETKIARLEGQLADPEQEEVETADDATGEIVACARKVAEARRSEAAEQLLVDLGKEILELGQGFGMTNLEEVRPNLAAAPNLVIGGAKTNFGALDPGQRLRLRLATVIALIRVGERHGVGRHPGLLLVDTPGGEEMADKDVTAVLDQIKAVTEEIEGLQVLCATARAQQVRELLGEERIIHGPDYGEVW